jgi:hypothetical protein
MINNTTRHIAAYGFATLLSAYPLQAEINVTEDEVIAEMGDSITDTSIVIDNNDVARVTGGDLTLTDGTSVTLINSGSYIQTGGNVDASGSIDINRNVATGDVVFEIHGGKFNTLEATGVHLAMPYAANGLGGDSGAALVTEGELHLDELKLSHTGGANSGTSYSFTQTGGVTKFRELTMGTASSPALVTFEVSGGEIVNDHAWRTNLIDSATFHVNGSGATLIDFWSDFESTANTTLKFTVDDGGVTPIQLNSGLDDTLYGTIDMEVSGETPSDGTVFTLFTADDSGDIYGNLTLDAEDVNHWSLQVSGDDLAAIYIGAQPPVITIEADGSYLDQALEESGVTRNIYDSTIRIGRRGTDLENWVAVIPMELPDLNEGSIESATVEFYIVGASNTADANLNNIDLYGSSLYDYVGSAADSRFFVDGENPTNPDATLLTDDLFTHAELVADDWGWRVSADVGSFIQDFYDAGAQPGAFVYFILTNDQTPTGSYQYITYQSADEGSTPKMTLEVSGAQTVGTSYGTTSSITQRGVTWTFAEPVTYGTFITGDYWVVGPVTVTSISNSLNDSGWSPRTGQNGTMLNPLSDGQDRGEQGYDDGIVNYNAALNAGRPNGLELSASNPLDVPTDSTLVSSVSWLYNSSTDFEPGTPEFNGGTLTPRPVTRAVSILTILDAAPEDYSFRPPYAGGDKDVDFKLSDLDASKLSNLQPVGDSIPDPIVVETQFSKPWIDHVFEYIGSYSHPSDHMEHYGQRLAQQINEAALMLNMDYSQLSGSPDKQPLLIGFVQLGIDLAGIADNGGGWRANGGHSLGRKFPILFAGLLLDDQHMQDVGIWGINDNNGVSGVEFQENQNTFYVTQAEVDLTQSGLIPYSNQWPSDHPGVTPDGLWDPDYRNVWDSSTETVVEQYTPYTTADIGMPDWGIRHSYEPAADNGHLDAKYRTINGSVYPGIALSVQIMNATTEWNYDAFLDYADRYMDWTDGGDTEGNPLPQFVEDMWDAYRADYTPIWQE